MSREQTRLSQSSPNNYRIVFLDKDDERHVFYRAGQSEAEALDFTSLTLDDDFNLVPRKGLTFHSIEAQEVYVILSLRDRRKLEKFFLACRSTGIQFGAEDMTTGMKFTCQDHSIVEILRDEEFRECLISGNFAPSQWS